MDLILDWLKMQDLEVTQENYLGLAYPDSDPADYTEDMLDEWRAVRKTRNEN